MDEHKLLRQRERASRAKAVVESEGFLEALKEIDAALIERLRVETEPAKRDAIWQAMQCYAEVPRVLKNTMAKGKMAERDLGNIVALSQPRAA